MCFALGIPVHHFLSFFIPGIQGLKVYPSSGIEIIIKMHVIIIITWAPAVQPNERSGHCF